MDKDLKKIEEKAILTVSEWWGFPNAGYSGTIITSDKELYVYQYYHHIQKELEGKLENFLTKKRDLNDEEFRKVIDFINLEVLSKDYENNIMRDAGFDVKVNYNGISKIVSNNKGIDGTIELYDKAKEFVDGLAK